MSNEADTRIIIDRLLRETDWDIEEKAQVHAGSGIIPHLHDACSSQSDHSTGCACK